MLSHHAPCRAHQKKGIIADCLIRLNSPESQEHYPDILRLVTYIDQESGEEHQFFTNNFKLAARTIAYLYKSRWQIEIFFKWIKQNLKIKSFLGTSKNAVMSQIWAAMIYYLLLSFFKFQTKCRHSLHELTRIISEILLFNVNLIEILTVPFNKFIAVKRKKLPAQLSFNF
ncbi:MAG: transposase [Candidatus Latescibacteria bacterium]|nr:transposase [Candidatus Latescibacterota bacterium]